MITGDEKAAPAPTKPADGCTLFWPKAITLIDCEEPQFVEIGFVNVRQQIVMRAVAIAGGNNEQPRPVCVLDTVQMFRKQPEARDVPIIDHRWDRGLQKDLFWHSS
jgi:hypothetical protein